MTTDEIVVMRHDYLLTHGFCAYCATVPKSEYPHCENRQLELEHIFQRLSKRIDDPANFVVTCRRSHLWKHASGPLGKIAALAWKKRNGEFDPNRLHQLTGLYVLGWVENQQTYGLPAWANALAKELLGKE